MRFITNFEGSDISVYKKSILAYNKISTYPKFEIRATATDVLNREVYNCLSLWCSKNVKDLTYFWQIFDTVKKMLKDKNILITNVSYNKNI